jgi:hypothetical protein
MNLFVSDIAIYIKFVSIDANMDQLPQIPSHLFTGGQMRQT